MKRLITYFFVVFCAVGNVSAGYFAEIDDDGFVKRVIVAKDANWCVAHLGGVWVETFMDTAGKNYAGKGFAHDAVKGNFVSPPPYQSWTLDENDKWQPPKALPDSTELYFWNEQKSDWVDNSGVVLKNQ